MELPTLDTIPNEYNPTHLLLIADTKLGKSTYVAQMAADGFTILYIDSDNGMSAMKHYLRDNLAALKRVIYIRTEQPAKFQMELFTMGIFRWNLTQDKPFKSMEAKLTDKMIEIIPTRIPRGLTLVNDSWTATALDAMETGAENKKTTLEDMSKGQESQSIYGDASMKLTLLCNIYQKAVFNVVTLAHPTVFEILQKPPGGKLEQIKQKDMILKDVIEVPLSSSRPHGRNMGKYFTDVGWLELDRMGRRTLDFRTSFGRISGGRPNDIGPIEEMSFLKLFGVPVEVPLISDWIRSYTTEEWKAVNSSPIAAPAGVTAGGELPKTPVNPAMSLLAKK